jgi:pimeloyl-ACP methyl ester carboxylesterase
MRLALKLAALGVALLAGGTVLVERRAAAREAQAEADFPPIGQIIDVGGVPVHVMIRGTGPDLVLIHGASGNLRDFDFGFIDLLSDRYRVIAFDRPGLGYTGRTDPAYDSAFATRAETLAEQATLLQAAAAQLGADKPLVLGQSYGGAVALAWALDHPDHIAGLILVSAPSQTWDGGLGPLYAVNASYLGGAVLLPVISAFAPAAQVRATMESIFAPNPVPPGYDAHVGAELVIRRSSLRANARQVAALKSELEPMIPRYGSLSLPVEIVHGDSDTVVPLQIHSAQLVHQIPGAVLTVLPGIGHMPHHSDPQAVTDAIDRAAMRAGLR